MQRAETACSRTDGGPRRAGRRRARPGGRAAGGRDRRLRVMRKRPSQRARGADPATLPRPRSHPRDLCSTEFEDSDGFEPTTPTPSSTDGQPRIRPSPRSFAAGLTASRKLLAALDQPAHEVNMLCLSFQQSDFMNSLNVEWCPRDVIRETSIKPAKCSKSRNQTIRHMD